MVDLQVIVLSILASAVAIVPIDEPIDINLSFPPIHPFPPVPRTCAQLHCPPRQHCVMRTLWIFCFDPPCLPWRYPICVPNILPPIIKVPIEIPRPDPISKHPV